MRSRTEAGPGRVLALVYAFFTLAAGARSLVQLLTDAGRAPVTYGLSVLAALIYLLGTLAIIRVDRLARHWSVAVALSCVELIGVLSVGVLSLLAPQLFPEASVWSGFGLGYGFVPLVLPILALLWLRSLGNRLAPSPALCLPEPDEPLERA